MTKGEDVPLNHDIYSVVSRIERIGKWVKPLFEMDMDYSALILIDFQIMLSKPFFFDSFNSKFKEFLASIKFEFQNKTRGIKGHNLHRTKCFDLVFTNQQIAVQNHFDNYNTWLRKSLQMMQERRDTINLWGEYLKMIRNPNHSPTQKIIGVCFSYLSTIEGFFEKDIRVCYSVVRMAKGEIIDPDEMNKLTISKIKEDTKENKELEFLFEGFNRHLRNSIAHFSFSWDNEEQQMDFRDYYYYEKTDTWSKWQDKMTQNQLIELNQKAVNVNQAVTLMFGIHAIQDACFGNRLEK